MVAMGQLGDPGTQPDRDALAAADRKRRLGHDRRDAVADAARLAPAAPADDDAEPVIADPGRQIVRPNRPAEQGAELGEHEVAGSITIGLVDPAHLDHAEARDRERDPGPMPDQMVDIAV